MGLAESKLDGSLRLAPNQVPVGLGRSGGAATSEFGGDSGSGVGICTGTLPKPMRRIWGLTWALAGVGVSENATPLLIQNANDWRMYSGYGGTAGAGADGKVPRCVEGILHV